MRYARLNYNQIRLFPFKRKTNSIHWIFITSRPPCSLIEAGRCYAHLRYVNSLLRLGFELSQRIFTHTLFASFRSFYSSRRAMTTPQKNSPDAGEITLDLGSGEHLTFRTDYLLSTYSSHTPTTPLTTLRINPKPNRRRRSNRPNLGINLHIQKP